MSSTVNVRRIIHDSIVDGPGIRSVIFTQGCNHNCFGCHNPKLLEINDKYLMSIDEIIDDIIANNFTHKVTISGGEPLIQKNIIQLAKRLKDHNFHIVLFSGFTIDQINDHKNKGILKYVDTLIDGKFEISLRDLNSFKGSTNQIIHDLKKED